MAKRDINLLVGCRPYRITPRVQRALTYGFYPAVVLTFTAVISLYLFYQIDLKNNMLQQLVAINESEGSMQIRREHLELTSAIEYLTEAEIAQEADLRSHEQLFKLSGSEINSVISALPATLSVTGLQLIAPENAFQISISTQNEVLIYDAVKNIKNLGLFDEVEYYGYTSDRFGAAESYIRCVGRA